MIKLCDLQQPKEVFKAVETILHTKRYVKGPIVEEFEKQWAKRCNMKYAIAVGNGAQALELAIQIIFDQTAITYNEETYKAVPNAIEKTGHVAVRSNIYDIYAHHLHDHKINFKPILEDCSHVHGYKPVADTAIFSFFPTKILGACGEAGIIVTNKKDVYNQARELRSHGEHGTNARMDEIQAAVLLAKLPYLDKWIKRRKDIVDMYDKELGNKTPGKFHYAYCIEGSKKKLKQLLDMGIESAFYYTEQYMALPLHPFMTNGEVKEVIRCVKQLK